MLPILLVSQKLELQEEFIRCFITENKFDRNYIFRVQPIKTEISIDQMRSIKKEIITDLPLRRLFVIYQFDTASLEAQNALLKTLEERNEKNQFVLVIKDIERVLPTVSSRSKLITLDEHKVADINASVKDLLASLENSGGVGFLTPVSGISRDDALKLFDHIIVVLKDELSEGEKFTATVLKKALTQKSLLLNNNLNPQLAVDSFLLYIRKQAQNFPNESR